MTELQTVVEARQRLESQQQENIGVQKVNWVATPLLRGLTNALQEFKKVSDSSGIYKLIGPVLLKQDKTEASMAVDGRLEFIDKEM